MYSYVFVCVRFVRTCTGTLIFENVCAMEILEKAIVESDSKAALMIDGYVCVCVCVCVAHVYVCVCVYA